MKTNLLQVLAVAFIESIEGRELSYKFHALYKPCSFLAFSYPLCSSFKSTNISW